MNSILVVGFGSIGKRHIENILSNYDAQVIVCTKRIDLKSYQKKGVKVVHSLDEAFAYKPNIGFVTNETSYHIKTAVKLANAGMDLFVEKPLSHSMQGVQKLYKIIQKKNLITQIGCNMRFHPCIQKIKEVVDEGALGRILSAQVESGSYLPDWHPYEDYRDGYAAKNNLGGGVALTCIHEVDYLYWFFGDIIKIFSVSGKYSDLTVTADDLTVMTLLFRNNIVGEIHLDYFQRPDFKSCKIKGTRGALYWDSVSNAVKIYTQNEKQWKTILSLAHFERNAMYVDELHHFLKCVQKRTKTINDITDGIKTLQIVLNAKKSSRLGKMIKIPYIV